MPVAELGTSTEALSSQELGRRAHEIMVGLIGSLSASPEFTSAVVKHFFARSFRHHSPQSVSNYGVYFVKGDYGYSVRYSSEPLRYADGGPNMPVDAWMSIYKYDTRIRNERNHPKRVSSVHLSTSFDEDKNKNITEFRNGGVHVEDETGKHQDTPDVFDKVAEILSDLTQPAKL
ncbi:hypothetical protein A2W70_01210 [Candidatus Curtissbacteria bacterium RIFCSPLOWO2_02_41_11]|uniref:Uncharacterized protein n=2 Tax=Candidatus Curtissiibacteriota TaxID=1752717 RepID=A0A1F5HQV9_9BACT|nr:MAG: hypothetical protein UU56_C0028G0005 [Candidatus Curtissbacteria bacterium GW2011_GWA2_41_24]OGD89122.1 MAG: hypothetical protein A2Z54_02820 [Candidatus Curtissbacteria bacterium RIFCSPHIGHO2_02_39_8]OGE06466.1 MAG: hypothetical protein A2W70_01210 [Candidatus Curtissbacteria bacterium RIFCSPLOWO2_02_41_11]